MSVSQAATASSRGSGAGRGSRGGRGSSSIVGGCGHAGSGNVEQADSAEAEITSRVARDVDTDFLLDGSDLSAREALGLGEAQAHLGPVEVGPDARPDRLLHGNLCLARALGVDPPAGYDPPQPYGEKRAGECREPASDHLIAERTAPRPRLARMR